MTYDLTCELVEVHHFPASSYALNNLALKFISHSLLLLASAVIDLINILNY